MSHQLIPIENKNNWQNRAAKWLACLLFCLIELPLTLICG